MNYDPWVVSMKHHRPDIWRIRTEFQARSFKAGVCPVDMLAFQKHGSNDDEDKENTAADTLPYDTGSPRPKLPVDLGKTPQHDPRLRRHKDSCLSNTAVPKKA